MAIVLANGFIPIIPALIWNALLTKRLPKKFGSESHYPYAPQQYMMLSCVFIGVHLTHAVLVFRKTGREY